MASAKVRSPLLLPQGRRIVAGPPLHAPVPEEEVEVGIPVIVVEGRGDGVLAIHPDAGPEGDVDERPVAVVVDEQQRAVAESRTAMPTWPTPKESSHRIRIPEGRAMVIQPPRVASATYHSSLEVDE